MGTTIDTEPKWYILSVWSGKETKVQEYIAQLLESNPALKTQIFETKVPTEDKIVEKDGKRKVKTEKKYSGYVFIKMIYSTETAYQVTSLQNVSSFLGPKDKPTPLGREEILRNGLETRNDDSYDYEVGDSVSIIKGVFEGNIGTIKKINAEKKTINIVMQMFGRDTSFDLNFDDVQKVVKKDNN